MKERKRPETKQRISRKNAGITSQETDEMCLAGHDQEQKVIWGHGMRKKPESQKSR